MADVIALASDPSPPVTIPWGTGRWLLKTGLAPASYGTAAILAAALQVWIATDAVDHTTDPRVGVFQPLGRPTHVVVGDAVSPPAKLTVELTIISDADHIAVLDLLATRSTLILSAPYGDQWYVRVIGQRTATLVYDTANPARLLTLDLVEVAAP